MQWSLSAEKLRESMGRRFTVTLNRHDFSVHINDTKLTENECLPDWELRIPNKGYETCQLSMPNGKQTELRYWVGFVNKADWPQEEAGAGVYAHGKIAQDRPYFFGVKGSEVFTRYMYAVIEADWIDELYNDAISTDRTSIDWEKEEFTEFKTWGENQVKEWIKTYKKHRKDKAEKENLETVQEVLDKTGTRVTESEVSHVTKLLADITPNMHKNPEQKEKLVEATLKAWTHEPARKLIKKLWQETSKFDENNFSDILFQLFEQLVPESLSLGVVFSQRVFALTKLNENIMLGNEVQLQKLIEEFSWILDNQYERFFARNSLANIVKQAHKEDKWNFRPHPTKTLSDNTFPDFVFLSSTDNVDILVVEIKKPDLTASWEEFNQLQSYVQYLQSRNENSDVRGVLIAGGFNEGIKKQKPKTIDFFNWDIVLKTSRRTHMQLLSALLAGTEADAQDTRVKQICDLGGQEITGFLERMANNSPELENIIKKLGSN